MSVKPIIKIAFQNGLDFDTFKKEVFDVDSLDDLYDFEESDRPDFIVFGPYGNNIPPEGNYTRIGYYCENIIPDLDICDWAFGMPDEGEINHPRYKRIQWHGVTPEQLTKPSNYDADAIFAQKTNFCNFLYSHKVPYREEFFRQLSKYKKVDAPGKSMNNMPGIDTLYKGNFWERKRRFLSFYKFTIAFENDTYPGYQTEKLHDAMRSNSIPLYFGDPLVGQIFNTDSFLDSADFTVGKSNIANWLQTNSQTNFVDIRPGTYHGIQHRFARKAKAIGRDLKMQIQYRNINVSALIERVVELDRDDKKYIEMLKQPWLINNTPPENASNKKRWQEIFDKTL